MNIKRTTTLCLLFFTFPSYPLKAANSQSVSTSVSELVIQPDGASRHISIQKTTTQTEVTFRKQTLSFGENEEAVQETVTQSEGSDSITYSSRYNGIPCLRDSASFFSTLSRKYQQMLDRHRNAATVTLATLQSSSPTLCRRTIDDTLFLSVTINGITTLVSSDAYKQEQKDTNGKTIRWWINNQELIRELAELYNNAQKNKEFT